VELPLRDQHGSVRDDLERHNPEKIALSVPEVAQALSIGCSQAWKMINNGTLRSFRIGRRVLVSKATLEEWVLRAEESGWTTADEQGGMSGWAQGRDGCLRAVNGDG
jgi:excisionase family DNA binding protein